MCVEARTRMPRTQQDCPEPAGWPVAFRPSDFLPFHRDDLLPLTHQSHPKSAPPSPLIRQRDTDRLADHKRRDLSSFDVSSISMDSGLVSSTNTTTASASSNRERSPKGKGGKGAVPRVPLGIGKGKGGKGPEKKGFAKYSGGQFGKGAVPCVLKPIPLPAPDSRYWQQRHQTDDEQRRGALEHLEHLEHCLQCWTLRAHSLEQQRQHARGMLDWLRRELQLQLRLAQLRPRTSPTRSRSVAASDAASDVRTSPTLASDDPRLREQTDSPSGSSAATARAARAA